MTIRYPLIRSILIVALASSLQGLHGATLKGAPTFGNPDRPWGTRRPVTSADRKLIAGFRSGQRRPTMETDFSDPNELPSLWSLQSDDESSLQSCRRPRNVVIAHDELQLRTLDATDCKARWSTGAMISKARQRYGFFEAKIKAADISGINNAFWLVTDGHYEIDIAEIHYPGTVRLTLHNNNNWDTQNDDKTHAVGFNSVFTDDFSKAYHDYGVLWTPNDVIYEIDGEPIAAISTHDSIQGAADIRFSTAVMEYAGKIPANPAGHAMYVRSLRVYAF